LKVLEKFAILGNELRPFRALSKVKVLNKRLCVLS